MTRAAAMIAICVLPTLGACEPGPPVPIAIDGEPVCVDYRASGKPATMHGGMRVPVVVTLFDGKKQIARETVFGRRESFGPQTAVTVPDDSAEYKVEWAQCQNRRAERLLSDGLDTGYQCGEAKVYKTDKLVMKRGDAENRALRFAPPPDPSCWVGDAVPLPAPPP